MRLKQKYKLKVRKALCLTISFLFMAVFIPGNLTFGSDTMSQTDIYTAEESMPQPVQDKDAAEESRAEAESGESDNADTQCIVPVGEGESTLPEYPAEESLPAETDARPVESLDPRAGIWMVNTGSSTHQHASLEAAVAFAVTHGSSDIIITGDATQVETLSNTITVNPTMGNKNITIRCDGTPITLYLATGNDSKRHFAVENGTLILENIILDGQGAGGGVRVEPNGALEMKTGAEIQNTVSTQGGGVFINQGKFTLAGGKITNSKATGGDGGGVYNSQGMLIITGGEISGNNASRDGGGVTVLGTDAVFILSGGTISGNTAQRYGGGMMFYYLGTYTMSGGEVAGNTAKSFGGGIYLFSCIFRMANGTISGNTADLLGGGVYVDTAEFTLEGGEIGENQAVKDGGGIYTLNSTLVIKGGAVTDNRAVNGAGMRIDAGYFAMENGAVSNNLASKDGGGVMLSGATSHFLMKGSSVIAGNGAVDGAGVYVNLANMQMEGGEIRENTAVNAGGALLLYNGSATMEEGEIRGNHANGGGGVYIYDSSFTMNGGAVRENGASGGGGGISLRTAGGTLTITQGAITDNTAGSFAGGIYTGTGGQYNNMVIEEPVVLSGNTAGVSYKPPSNALTRFPTIQTASSSIYDHPLNGFDINFTAFFVVVQYVGMDGNLLSQQPLPNSLYVAAGNSFTPPAEEIPGYIPRYYMLSPDGTTQFALDEAQTVNAYMQIQVFYASTILDIEFPVGGMKFNALHSGNGAVFSPSYEFENKSELPLSVSFKKMSVIDSDGVTFVADTAVSTGSRDIHLNLLLPVGVSDNGFTAGVNHIVPDTVYTTPVVLGILDDKFESAGGNASGYLTIGGLYTGAFTTIPSTPQLTFAFHCELTQ